MVGEFVMVQGGFTVELSYEHPFFFCIPGLLHADGFVMWWLN
jgi:hypothetical protein